MRTIVLPGSGQATAFTPTEDSTVGVLVNGEVIHISLKAGVTTRVEFLNSRAVAV